MQEKQYNACVNTLTDCMDLNPGVSPYPDYIELSGLLLDALSEYPEVNSQTPRKELLSKCYVVAALHILELAENDEIPVMTALEFAYLCANEAYSYLIE